MYIGTAVNISHRTKSLGKRHALRKNLAPLPLADVSDTLPSSSSTAGHYLRPCLDTDMGVGRSELGLRRRRATSGAKAPFTGRRRPKQALSTRRRKQDTRMGSKVPPFKVRPIPFFPFVREEKVQEDPTTECGKLRFGFQGLKGGGGGGEKGAVPPRVNKPDFA